MKRTVVFYLVFYFGLSVIFSSCDQVYRVLQKEGAEEKDLVGELLPFEPNPTVQKIQRLLKLYGYAPGPVDGKMGTNTRNAVAQFQQDNNLTVNRFVDQETWACLNRFAAKSLVQDGQVNTVAVQAALRKAGLNPGGIDGRWGKQTQNALVMFQKSHNLHPDGRIGYKTLNQLMAYLPEPEASNSGEAVAAQ